MIAIGSVRHTGTRFTRELLKVPNYHFGEKNLERINGFTVITPLRRLDRIMVSWARRDMGLADLHQALDIMVGFESDYYLPIDSDRRDDYLATINTELDEDFQTDWAVLQDPKISAPEWGIDPVWGEKIHTDFDAFFSESYGRN